MQILLVDEYTINDASISQILMLNMLLCSRHYRWRSLPWKRKWSKLSVPASEPYPWSSSNWYLECTFVWNWIWNTWYVYSLRCFVFAKKIRERLVFMSGRGVRRFCWGCKLFWPPLRTYKLYWTTPPLPLSEGRNFSCPPFLLTSTPSMAKFPNAP